MIKLALPTGDLRGPTAELLSSVGLNVEGYGEGSRQYRLPVAGSDEVRVRVFRERDIPMQVALGNYDIGITSLSWVMEMQERYRQQPVAPLVDLGIGRTSLFAAIARPSAFGKSLQADQPRRTFFGTRIASEFPNIAETFARAWRLGRYRIQTVAGAAESYPPEDADLVIINAADEAGVRSHGLEPLMQILDNSAWMIANIESVANRDLSPVLSRLFGASRTTAMPPLRVPYPNPTSDELDESRDGEISGDAPLRLAIPDGHQQRHVYGALAKAGITFDGYEEKTYVRRPKSSIPGLEVKVIRPQDMPQLIAFGEFDIAITGRDLLLEHTFAFPSTPAVEVLDLQVSQYNLSAVVDGELPADNIGDAMAYWRKQGRDALTVAAEFPATADHYARSRHFWRYRVMPIAGASEGFVPEDADLLIEGTETGRTIAENNLKVLDNIFRSTTCLIARKDAALTGERRDTYNEVFGALQRSLA